MGEGEGSADFVRVLCAYFVPPVGAFMQVGLGVHFWINLVLTLVGFLPGVLHAIWLIATTGPGGRPSPGGNGTFVALIAGSLLPPVGVFMKRGVGVDLLLSVVLTALFWIPGMVHAAWVITTADS